MNSSPQLAQIADLLGSIARPDTFATSRSGRASDLEIVVAGVGALTLPLTADTARRLITVAAPAHFGRRDQTLFDPAVRDTWELPARALAIAPARWQPALAAQLAKIANDLELPPGVTLRAELHNLLVYEPGQHFAQHRDSEKAPRMVGSLVVMLPSTSRGGELVIRQRGETHRYRGSASALTFVAFFADCHHEVRRVTSGYRAALTFNLILEGEVVDVDASDGVLVERLTAAVDAHFTTPPPASWRLSHDGPPDRLVYLLDHQYTPAGLAWSDLKRGDARRAALLRAVAARLECDVALALADVHEVWSCEDEYWSDRRRDDDDDDDDDDEPAVDGHTLIELCDSDLELHHAIDGDGRRARGVAAGVVAGEVCETRPSIELAPYRSEHEGYTGNAGNSVDRWYHRAAIVVWPRRRQFVLLAKASPVAALATLGALLRRGKQAEASARIDELRSFWGKTVRRVADRVVSLSGATHDVRRIGERALTVAARLDDADRAAVLVEPLQHGYLRMASAPALAEIIDRHGAAWLAGQIDAWAGRDRIDARTTWMAEAPPLFARVAATAGAPGRAWVGQLARAEWPRLRDHLRDLQAGPAPHAVLARLSALAPTIVSIIAAARIADDDALVAEVCETIDPATGYPITAAVAMVRAAHAKIVDLRRDVRLATLAAACRQDLHRRVSSPARAKDNWSIATTLRCHCDLCQTLGAFAADARQTRLAWPLAEARRNHVHSAISAHELPISLVLRRVGSPYTLELTKTRVLFSSETAARERWRDDLTWLTAATKPRRPSRPSR